MKSDFYSYLDGFNRITIIYPHALLSHKEKQFCIIDEEQVIELTIVEANNLGKEMKYVCSINETISLNRDYVLLDEGNNRSMLRSGSIVRSDLFEMLYFYHKDDLGFIYTKEKTIFKVWSPVAHELELELVDLEGNYCFLDFEPSNRGLWTIEVEGDLECFKYRFNVRVNDYFQPITDPYGISSNANGAYNYVIDQSKVYQFKYSKPEFSGRPVDAVIYELHIRDFTIDQFIHNEHAGKFLGLLERGQTPAGHPTGLEYLKYLGVTHIQLLPINDFEGVDELSSDSKYNWGYNPKQYNVPEGWYTTNPNDPYARINELRILIDEIHRIGMRVSMDVVYNHVNDVETFPLQVLVPAYYFRYDQRGMLTQSSGCGNDFASEKKMARAFILQSVKFWANFYQISSFRFDLMGLLDVETMNQVHLIIRDIDPASFIYGEGWNMNSGIPDHERANMSNYRFLPEIGFFNDKYRNYMRGDAWSKTRGFALGGKASYHDLIYLFTGSSLDNYMFSSPHQSLNYIECHDNYTFFDIATHILPKEEHGNIMDYQALATSLVLLSQGMPFLHAGQEVFRTKFGVENSYHSPDEINMFRWADVDRYWEYVEMVRDLISIRKEFFEFRYDKKSLIKSNIKYYDDRKKNSCPKFTILGIDRVFYIIIKNDYQYEYIPFDQGNTLIFDGRRRVKKYIESISVERPGVYLIRKGTEE